MQMHQGRSAPQRGQALALWEARSEGYDRGEVNHLHASKAVGHLADRHFNTVISHLGSDLKGRRDLGSDVDSDLEGSSALSLVHIDVTRLSQAAACETVWKREHERMFESRHHNKCMCVG